MLEYLKHFTIFFMINNHRGISDNVKNIVHQMREISFGVLRSNKYTKTSYFP